MNLHPPTELLELVATKHGMMNCLARKINHFWQPHHMQMYLLGTLVV